MGKGLQPFVGKIFVEPVEDAGDMKVTESGLIASVKTEDNETFIRGNVVAVGKGFPYENDQSERDVRRAPMEVKVGDVVIYVRTSAVITRYDGKDYYIISEKDIFAVDPA